MTAFLTFFRRFPTTFQRFPKVIENLSEGHTNVTEHFLKISEDARKFPEIARHSSPGCSLLRILRVVYFPEKHSCPYNKYLYLSTATLILFS